MDMAQNTRPDPWAFFKQFCYMYPSSRLCRRQCVTLTFTTGEVIVLGTFCVFCKRPVFTEIWTWIKMTFTSQF